VLPIDTVTYFSEAPSDNVRGMLPLAVVLLFRFGEDRERIVSFAEVKAVTLHCQCLNELINFDEETDCMEKTLMMILNVGMGGGGSRMGSWCERVTRKRFSDGGG
jgi:hypothetical protein